MYMYHYTHQKCIIIGRAHGSVSIWYLLRFKVTILIFLISKTPTRKWNGWCNRFANICNMAKLNIQMQNSDMYSTCASDKHTRNIRIIILHKNTCVAVTWTLWCFLGDIHVGSITEFGLGGVTWLMPKRHNTLSLSYWWSIDLQYNYRYIMEKDWKLLHVRDAITSTHFTYTLHCFNIKACPLATCWPPDTWHAVLHFKGTEFSWNCKTEIIVLALGQFCCECRLLQCSHQVIIVSCVRCSVFQCFITALL